VAIYDQQNHFVQYTNEINESLKSTQPKTHTITQKKLKKSTPHSTNDFFPPIRDFTIALNNGDFDTYYSDSSDEAQELENNLINGPVFTIIYQLV
jgi:hypothetical protein